jgi:hypothetical protein
VFDPEPSSLARVTKRMLAVCLAVVAALALPEIVMWIWRPFPIVAPLYPGDCDVSTTPSPQSVIDPDIGWRFAPNAVIDDPSPDFHVVYRCNADGFREVQPREGRDEASNVVFIGDSFVFGVGVDEKDTLAERFADARKDVRVTNLGMPGFGVDQMLCTLRTYGVRAQPTLVVAVFVVDDLSRSMTAYRDRNGWSAKPTFTLDRGTLVPLTINNEPSSLRRWIARSFYLAEAWRRAENKFGLEYGFGERFDVNRALFVAMNSASRSAGANLLVVHVPQRGAWRPIPDFGRALRARGVHFLDLGETRIGDTEALFFAHDPHLTALGHLAVADALLRAFDEGEAVLLPRNR